MESRDSLYQTYPTQDLNLIKRMESNVKAIELANISEKNLIKRMESELEKT